MKISDAAMMHPHSRLAWLKRLGMGGFLFFLAKGLLWLTVPAMLTMAGLD